MPMPEHAKLNRSNIRDNIPDATDSEIDGALASVDQDAIHDEERTHWSVEIWDRQSSINGVSADHFLNRDDVSEDGEIYLLKRDGNVVMFQPHEPGVAGLQRIPRGQGKRKGSAHADGIAANNAAGEVLRQVSDRIQANRGNQ